jgi:DUF4097 and DUF4098 domain-containing protein YvlB
MKTVFIIILVFVVIACFVAAGVIALTTNVFTNGWHVNIFNWEERNMNVNMAKPLDFSGVEKVKIYMQTGDATITPSATNEAKVTGFVIGSPDRIVFETQKNGSELDITVKQVSGIFNFTIGELALSVGMPADYKGELEVSGATSKITVGDFALAAFKSHLTTGELIADIVSAGQVTMESTTGKVTLNGKNRNYGNIKITTTTGAIDVGQLNAGELNCGSTTGHVTIDSVKASKITAGATTGRIDIINCEGAVDARAMTGSVSADLKSFSASYFETTTGGVTLRLPANAAFNLDARTTTGHVSTDYTFMGEVTGERKFSAGAEIKGSTNGGGQEIKIRTTTGSVQVNKGN